MSTQRIDRVNELLQREIAQGLYHLHTADEQLDLARITISHVSCSPDLRKAMVMVSVLEDSPEAADAEHVVRVLNRRRKELQGLLASNVILKYTPHLQFRVDNTLSGAGRVLNILDQLPIPEDADEVESDGE